LAARFATKAIYADLMEIYRNAGEKLPTETRPGFLAYFAKHNEEEALSLIEQTLENLAPGEDFNVLPDLTRLFYSDDIDALLRKRLESDEPQKGEHCGISHLIARSSRRPKGSRGQIGTMAEGLE